ncbi:NRDE family protein [Thiolinea disciformis]|uniref:NRDE family protein n=1 Tax=Thiolinea disciformis TaxID=125614 RepID=UPI00036D09D1|nr:NRDE family protein [Thiolinea disciformis]
MCLALFALNQHPAYPFILLHNRDERFDRDSAALQTWHDNPALVGGRDLESGGSWLALNQINARLAFVTNVRHFPTQAGERSRGWLVTDTLTTQQTIPDYLNHIVQQQDTYAGFNLIAGTLPNQFYYLSNRQTPNLEPLADGLYGLSNAALDTPWPKVEHGKTALKAWLAKGESLNPDWLLDLLLHSEMANDQDLPDTGIGLEGERWLSPLFIRNTRHNYGTRCSSLIAVNKQGQGYFYERSYLSDKRYVSQRLSFYLV